MRERAKGNMQSKDVWAAGDLYEPYVGRWSRLVAREFVSWLSVPMNKAWLDVGCGTGALTQVLLEMAAPRTVKGIDPSAGYVDYAAARTASPIASFKVGDAASLPVDSASVDAAVAGLVLNFVPQPSRAVAEMVRAVRPGGVVAAYVWDYSGKMELMRYFWDAAVALDPTISHLDEGRRFPLCATAPLSDLFNGAGLSEVEVRSIDVPTHFRDFDDYWSPFLGGQGPAPGYAISLTEEARSVLREQIRSRLPTAEDGAIALIARAWAVRGRAPARVTLQSH
jgi:SAM-dependent methyltransferase